MGRRRKPADVLGRIEPPEILRLTVVLDHAVIDGAAADRFARKRAELIESGCGLDGWAAALVPDFAVFAYDRRGRGDSADTPPYAVEREVEDLEAVI